MSGIAHLASLAWRRWAVLLALAAVSSGCLTLLAGRLLITRETDHLWLAKNLFLAWLPVLAALGAHRAARFPSAIAGGLVLGCAGLWLSFFPNAPYLITDLIHLRPRPEITIWYDLLLVVAFAWTGTLLGLVSLYLMQQLVRRYAGRLVAWLFALAMLCLGGYGVYLGRFMRLNSWDALLRPLALLTSVAAVVLHPVAHWRTVAFSGLVALLLAGTYIVLVAFSQMAQPEPPAPRVRQPAEPVSALPTQNSAIR